MTYFRIGFVSFSLACFGLAQIGSGGLAGTVVDESGAAIPAVSIVVENADSGARFEAISNENGLFRVTSLLPGGYRIKATKPGFENLARPGVIVTTGQTVAIDLTLKIGTTSEIVTIQESAPLAETQSQSVGQLINRRMVAGLPMPNRAASSLVALAPGVVMIDPGSGAENYPVFSVAGGRGRNQHFRWTAATPRTPAASPGRMQMTSLPMDAMQEFRVVSNNYSAEFGHSAGGVISLTTRSGINELHGSLFEFHRNNVLDARNFFARQKPPLRLNQYGFALGGPIRKDKTHYFVSWERTQQISSVTRRCRLSQASHSVQGDFSRLRNSAGDQVLIYDPGYHRRT